ncbi:hypothetical protein N7492_007739 [Penicillium capsulatum]|uniref:UBX domain-containing protein 2 n=1 Tax=Penicillium capsulatum TaxID=69766 RepID=A0A9W9LL51_9EURO|nr:hypothetical protein N7492_007739 [Penicillium capsulatum]KAJ6117571.1 hypothetical protein N7512_007296 [Penicillium capsulatum]
MALFYQGSLQDGIALAMREAKAVVCFVRDDAELSTTWEQDYFGDDEVAQALSAKAVVLRLNAGSQEAGFLSSICPVAKFPTVTVIMNGTLKEYIVPDVSKDDFRTRLSAALDGQSVPSSDQQTQSPPAASNDTAAASRASAPTNVPGSVPSQAPPQQSTSDAPKPTQSKSQETRRAVRSSAKKAPQQEAANKPAPPKPQPSQEAKKETPSTKQEKKSKTPQKASVSADEESEPKRPVPRGPPSQYRLQVRLFDGSSVRSSFTPTQTIGKDVRPWLDGQMGDEKRPYNLKHILTPLPSRTLSVAEESQSLQDLGLGSTANLVMIPVQTYTEAYASSGSLPMRGASAIYNIVSSVATTATGLVGSLVGYGPSAPATETPATQAPAESSQRSRPTGPQIRTLRDQQDRGDSQLYNGNQLNFEPRNRDNKED